MKILPAIERRRITNMILRYLKPKTKWMKTMILGRPFVVESKEWQQWASDYEPHTTDYIRRNVKKGDIVLDIGAHVGYYTLLFAELVGPEGIVFAFEPNPDVMKVLEYNVKANGYDNIVLLVQKAVGASNEKAKLFVPEVTDAASLKPMTGVRRVYEVEQVCLDDYGIMMAHFVKMDIEGGELDALRGMSNLLRHHPRLVIEFCPEILGHHDAEAMMNMLEGYTITGMDRNIVCD
jgi:FkbM family methyltransferase